jgi:hypothetical protein
VPPAAVAHLASCAAQLAYVEERIKAVTAAGAAEAKTMDEIQVCCCCRVCSAPATSQAARSCCPPQALQAKIDQAGIKNNRHTSLTARDCEVQWKQYVAFLQTKRQMLADQIETKKLRGVS